MTLRFTYRLNPGVRVLPEAMNAFLLQQGWIQQQTIGGEVVVSEVKRKEDGFPRSVTITYRGETFTIKSSD